MKLSLAAACSAVVLSATLVATPAEACSPPLPGFGGARPVTGSDVPPNAVIFVDGYDFAPFEAYWFDFDVFLPLSTDRMLGLGLARFDFEPQSFLPMPIDMTFNHTGEYDIEPLRLEYQVTRDTVDDQPPVVFDPASVRWEWRDSEPGLCEPGGYVVMIEVPAATDDWGVSVYGLRELPAGEPPRDILARLAPLEGDEVRLQVHAGFEPGPRCYQIFAYDVAGNLGIGEPLPCVDVGTPQVDAGFADAGASDAASPTPRDAGTGTGSGLAAGGRGCSCDLAHEVPLSRPAGASVALLAGLAILGGRRRRR